MPRLPSTQIVLAIAIGLLVSHAASAEDADPVVHVYVVRRALQGQPLPAGGVFAHSALLLRTKSGKHYTLEYMSDAKVHLTPGEPVVEKEGKEKKVADIKMQGWTKDGAKVLVWRRQLLGKPLAGGKSSGEPQQRMQGLMKDYSVFKEEHCHTAQERLRKDLGILD